MRVACSTNSLKVIRAKSGAASTCREATEPPRMPTSKPRSAAIRADMGSNTEAVWKQESEFSSARKAVRNS
ncbi:hypothetical protein D9M73_246610 [compost metagenome]